MNFPNKTFLTQNCQLFESDFDASRQVKPLRVMQFMQDIATTHATQIGLGWNEMHAAGMLWVLSKVKVVFDVAVTRQTPMFTLYTWPLAPERVFAERCFVAHDGEKQLFSATSMWTLISEEQRKILPAITMNNFFHGEYDTVKSDTTADYERVRLDDTFDFCYEKTIRRSDLDLNGHVNNTNYITYAVDVLEPLQEVWELQIVYHKELRLGDIVKIFCKRQGAKVLVVGQRDAETCFTVVLKTEKDK